MISNEKTRWVYMREIFNLECFSGPQDFGRGVRMIPLSKDDAGLFDNSIPRFHGRWADRQYWIIKAEPLSKSDLIDGDPAGGLRVLPILMLILISPHLKFGPSVFLKIEAGKTEVVAVVYDQLHIVSPHVTPNDFVKLNEVGIDKLREVFEKLVHNLFANILDIPRDRYVRACLDRRADDGIIDLSIALESLYGGKKDEIARRGASFLGSDVHERELIYTDLLVLFWARNKILHEGIVDPNITLEDGRKLDPNKIINNGFLHCANILKKMLDYPFWQGKTKREILQYFDRLAKPLKQEFDSYKQKYPSITRQRNS
jgi:hypothetical protein